MISNCDKFKALVPIVNDYEYITEGRYKDPSFYLFTYNKVNKDITIHIINIHKQYNREGKLTVWADWSLKDYKTEKSALKALSTCLRNIKEFYNLLRVAQAHEDF